MTPARTPAGNALTDLILSLFRANNLTLAWGDRLVAPLGLTSARWQVLGAIVATDRPEPVAWLARDLGANRQNVQRIVNDLEREGLVTFAANPHHKRAQLVVLSDKGKRVFEAAMQIYNPSVDRLSSDIALDDILIALKVVEALRNKLDKLRDPGE